MADEAGGLHAQRCLQGEPILVIANCHHRQHLRQPCTAVVPQFIASLIQRVGTQCLFFVCTMMCWKYLDGHERADATCELPALTRAEPCTIGR